MHLTVYRPTLGFAPPSGAGFVRLARPVRGTLPAMRRLWLCTAVALLGCSELLPEVADPPATSSGSSSSGTGEESTTTGATVDPDTTAGDTTDPLCTDALCSDGIFCNGTEICDPASPDADGLGCLPGPLPCPDEGLRCDEETETCFDPCALSPDADDDGFDAIACGGTDCDDTEPLVHPDADEECDALGVDEDCDPTTIGSTDADADGLVSSACCNGDSCGPDCDDDIEGFGLGDWAHCGACNNGCGVQQACQADGCIDARRVFVSSSTQTGAMAGLNGADAICQARADEAALGGTFRAYLIDELTGLERLEHPSVPFVRLDGVRIADDWGDLSDQSIQARLNINEDRHQVAAGHAWTGMYQSLDGVATCDSWTNGNFGCLVPADPDPCGGAGETSQTNDHWDGFFLFHCSGSRRLYCIEQ